MLARHFSDSDVGAVCGRLKLVDPIRRDVEESTYWKYESLIKYFEGKRGAVVGANGGLYAIRRRLFSALPSDTIVDDFVIALRVLDERFRVVYDPQAIAIEETTGDNRLEFKRRVRIAAGNFQSLRMFPWLLSPTAGFRAFALWSHKVLRWLAPALMAIAFLANLMLLEGTRYRLLLAAQVLFYALALAGSRGVFTGTLRRTASMAYYFVTMNWAIVVGFWRFIRHRQEAAWERTARV
jgi:cellulose synthase/poly-beta-1,6-N-acetylglucosamine synthase-like glycosyltransferase